MQKRKIQRLLAVAGAVVLISNLCSQQVMAAEFDIPGVDILQDQKREETPSEPEEEIPYVLPDLEGNGEGFTEQQVVTVIDDTTTQDSGIWMNQDGDDYDGTSVMSEGIYLLKRHHSAYDAGSDKYILYCGDNEVYCNVPPDTLLPRGEQLKFEVPNDVTANLYCNGNLVEQWDQLRDPGNYVLQIKNTGNEQSAYEFTILSDAVNNLEEFWAPKGFEIDFIQLNGENLTLIYSDYFKFSVDGRYRIGWKNEEIEKNYVVEFTLDRVAPTVTLNGVIGNAASCAVTLSDLEAGAGVAYEVDGEYHDWSEGEELTVPGEYRLAVFDAAGNYTMYEFTIHTYLNGSAYMALGMIFGAVIALFIYSRWLRKNMRVG